ncbi:MAG TPA: nucleotidyltransferase family protein [Candidatus Paceibacterota bacterium]
MAQDAKNIQAVILAAGKGTRMLPLTETRPKPMQMVAGKNLIEWKLEALPDIVTDVVMVIGYQGDQIRDYFGDSWKGRLIRYVLQHELNGTAGALWTARDLLHERFLVMMGDDLYVKEDILRMLSCDWAICAQEIVRQEMGGEILINPDGTFAGMNEPRHFIEHGLMNTGLYMLAPELFQYDPVPLGGLSSEYGLPQTLALLAMKTPVAVIRATKWLQVTTPEDLQRAKEFVSMSL